MGTDNSTVRGLERDGGVHWGGEWREGDICNIFNNQDMFLEREGEKVNSNFTLLFSEHLKVSIRVQNIFVLFFFYFL